MTDLSKTKPACRDSNMELLRIVAIALIVFSHFTYGNFHFAAADLTVPHLWIAVLNLFGKIGVNIFVLITGYYLIARKEYSVKPVKIIKYLAQCSFYSIGIFACFFIAAHCRHQSFIWKYPVFFPVLFQLWWFASIYFWLFILHPFLNRFLQNLPRNEYRKLIFVLLFSFCVIPSIIRVSYHSELLWFVILYVIAGYVRLHGDILLPSSKNGSAFCFAASVALFILMAVVRIAGIALEKRLPVFTNHTISLGEMHNVFTFLVAFYLFMAFLKLKIKYHSWINLLASATFGVYLIHEHPAIREFLWKKLFAGTGLSHSAMIIPYSVMAVAIVYFACIVIDLLRIYLLERPFLSVITARRK